MVQSNDRVVVIKPARPRPSKAPALQVCNHEDAIEAAMKKEEHLSFVFLGG